MEGLITKYYIRLFLLLGLVVVVSQVAKGRTITARQAAKNYTIAGQVVGVQMPQIVKI